MLVPGMGVRGAAVGASPSRLDRLGGIGVPTLVVHGTADPVFSVEHAVALADGIPEAELWLVEGLRSRKCRTA
ncbi:MAG: hypothetical protein Ct9H300mP12_05490 [Acidimicrobiales bacterium]|nr:MAG: hypothetical protein Ct9H300mP12_05490 [Acidimicrobiales bacterium]